jgi:soluble lytic murein transglycosylase-like protein
MADRRENDRQGASDAGPSKGKLRKPLIGLTLAGLAVPVVNAGVNPAAVEEGASEEEADAVEPVAADRDLDEDVGDYWAEAEERVVRAHTIEGAVTRYDIESDLAEKIYDAATAHGIEPDIAFGLVFTESTFRERAVSHVGARGLTQLMPRTAKWLNPGVTVRDLYNPDVNLDIGFKYLRQLIDKYEGNLEYALTAYNRGPGTVDRILDRGGNPDNGYAGKVLAG